MFLPFIIHLFPYNLPAAIRFQVLPPQTSSTTPFFPNLNHLNDTRQSFVEKIRRNNLCTDIYFQYFMQFYPFYLRGTVIIRVKAKLSSDASQTHICDQTNKLSCQFGQMTCLSRLFLIYWLLKHLQEYFPYLSSRENYKQKRSPRTERVMTALGPVVWLGFKLHRFQARQHTLWHTLTPTENTHVARMVRSPAFEKIWLFQPGKVNTYKPLSSVIQPLDCEI